MFGIFGKREHKEAADLIGVEIHHQLIEALKVDEITTSENLSSPFTPGYLTGFIWYSFTAQGYEGLRLPDKYVKHICNGVLPGKLWDIFKRQSAALDLANDLGKQDEIELYEQAVLAGVYDSGVFSALDHNEANNLFYYLTNQELKYERTNNGVSID